MIVLNNRKLVSFDLETFLIAPGMPVPKAVCLSYDDGDARDVVLRRDGLDLFDGWIHDKSVELCGQNVTFDLGVLAAEVPEWVEPIFEALDEGRIVCTKLYEMILQNSYGELKFEFDQEEQKWKRQGYDLQRIAWKRLQKFMPKGADTWRKRYALLDGVPICDWPEDAYKYALDDAADARRVRLSQMKEVAALPYEIVGEAELIQAGWAMHLMRVWGVRTEGAAVEKIKREIHERYLTAVEKAKLSGLVRDNGKRDMKAIRERVVSYYTALQLDVPMSDSGKNISTNRETLTNGLNPKLVKDEHLCAVAELVAAQKLDTTYVPILERGTVYPICADWNPMVESFRTSCAKPNLQNPPRAGGVRECFVPRSHKIVDVPDDYQLQPGEEWVE